MAAKNIPSYEPTGLTVAYAPAPNPNRLEEPVNRPADYLAWETSADYCRTEVEVDNSAGTSSMLPGTVIVDDQNKFVGILYGLPLAAGAVENRTVTHRGPCIVRGSKLIFPIAVDGADAGSDNAAETALLEASLRAEMAAAGIEIH